LSRPLKVDAPRETVDTFFFLKTFAGNEKDFEKHASRS